MPSPFYVCPGRDGRLWVEVIIGTPGDEIVAACGGTIAIQIAPHQHDVGVGPDRERSLTCATRNSAAGMCANSRAAWVSGSLRWSSPFSNTP